MIYPYDYDQKTITVVDDYMKFEDINDIYDINDLQLKEIKKKIYIYKVLYPGRHVEVLEYDNKNQAVKLIKKFHKAYIYIL